MRVYNYSEARQNLASLLNNALKEEIIIKRRNGSSFRIIPVEENKKTSPLEVEGINCNITIEEILASVRESRER